MLIVLALAGAAYYQWWVRPERQVSGEVAYVLANKLPVMDSAAQVNVQIGSAQNGEKLLVIRRTSHWAQVRLQSGQVGWVDSASLTDAETYAKGETLFKKLLDTPAQAEGHTEEPVNLHLEPDRQSVSLVQLQPNEKLWIYTRSIIQRPRQPGVSGGPGIKDVWYLVRSSHHAGWMLGRFVSLDIPPAIAVYAEGINMVAWLALNYVNDDGQRLPQYLVADRIGTQEFDFNHIRVFTYWVKRHKYVTAYVEGGFNGSFPLSVETVNQLPTFRLRLIDENGDKFQKVYVLHDTIVRPMGTVSGWDSNALPSPQTGQRREKRRPARRRR